MNVRALGYGTTSKTQAQSNDTDSTIKKYLDNIYKNYMTAYKDKLSPSTTFCNNRTTSTKVSGNYNNAGYGMNPTMYGYERYNNYASQGKLGPDLSCPLNDSFNVEGTNGNEKLTYPVGLITLDEVLLGGGVNGSVNTLYYLYSGTDYWTMSPAFFGDWLSSRVVRVVSSGELNYNGTNQNYGIRPVINIDPDKITFTGNGTMQDPYVIS